MKSRSTSSGAACLCSRSTTGRHIVILKGAPEAVLARASHAGSNDGASKPLDTAMRAALERRQNDYAAQGYRLLAIAWKDMPADAHELRAEDEN